MWIVILTDMDYLIQILGYRHCIANFVLDILDAITELREEIVIPRQCDSKLLLHADDSSRDPGAVGQAADGIVQYVHAQPGQHSQ